MDGWVGRNYLVEIVVLADQLLQLRLNVDDLFGGEFEFHDGLCDRLLVRG